MKYLGACAVSISALLLLCSCGIHQAVQPAPPTAVPQRVLIAPIGKHWQLIEEAPTLTNERHEQHPPFQTEQSLEPSGPPPATQEKPRTIETPAK